MVPNRDLIGNAWQTRSTRFKERASSWKFNVSGDIHWSANSRTVAKSRMVDCSLLGSTAQKNGAARSSQWRSRAKTEASGAGEHHLIVSTTSTSTTSSHRNCRPWWAARYQCPERTLMPGTTENFEIRYFPWNLEDRCDDLQNIVKIT